MLTCPKYKYSPAPYTYSERERELTFAKNWFTVTYLLCVNRVTVDCLRFSFACDVFKLWKLIDKVVTFVTEAVVLFVSSLAAR